MTSDSHAKIERIALRYAVGNFKFASARVAAIAKSTQGFVVTMSLSHSSEEIERLAVDGNLEEAEMKREFLVGEFEVSLQVEGDNVTSVHWKNVDFC